MRGSEANSSALQTARLPATVTLLIFYERQIILSSKKICEEDGWNPHEILRWRRMKLSTRKRSGSSRTFRKLQPTQIDYSRNSGVLRWRRSLLLVQKSRMCSLQKSNKQAHLLHRPAPAGRRQVWLAPTVSQNHPYRSRNGPAKCLLVKREHYVIFRNDHVCHYVSCLPVTPTTRLDKMFDKNDSSGKTWNAAFGWDDEKMSKNGKSAVGFRNYP